MTHELTKLAKYCGHSHQKQFDYPENFLMRPQRCFVAFTFLHYASVTLRTPDLQRPDAKNVDLAWVSQLFLELLEVDKSVIRLRGVVYVIDL